MGGGGVRVGGGGCVKVKTGWQEGIKLAYFWKLHYCVPLLI